MNLLPRSQTSILGLLLLGDDVLGLGSNATIPQRSGGTMSTNLTRTKLEDVSNHEWHDRMISKTYQVGFLSSHTSRIVLHLRLDSGDSILEVLLLLVVRLSSRVCTTVATIDSGGERVTSLLVGSSDTLGVGRDAVGLRSVAKDFVLLALKLVTGQ